MSHGVKKETYVNADEKTTKALTFDMLDSMGARIDEMVTCHKSQVEECKGKFNKIKNKGKKDTAIASVSGFGGGAFVVVTGYVKQWFDF